MQSIHRTLRHATATLLAVCTAHCIAADNRQIEQGREIFKLCIGCHATTPNDHRFGPSLAGVFNRQAGSIKGYDYSDELRKAKFRWNDARLKQWLEDEPKNMISGTRMEFPGIANPAEVNALIAYLKTLKAK